MGVLATSGDFDSGAQDDICQEESMIIIDKEILRQLDTNGN